VILTAILYQFGDLLESRRRQTAENDVFSYRFKPQPDYSLYERAVDWHGLWSQAASKCEEYSYALLLDVADFYNQIYHHVVENQLNEAGIPNELVRWIMALLKTLTGNVSRGVPVGPHAIHLLGFAQTGLFEGYYVVEIRIDRGDDFGFWKAGSKEAATAIVSEAKDGRFQTFTNEALRKEAVKAIFHHFYQHFELHPDFERRSIKEDLEARTSEESQPTMATARCTLDPWKSAKYLCRNCGKEWLGSNLTQGEMFSDVGGRIKTGQLGSNQNQPLFSL
jgi:hypothetical protein